MFFKKDKNSFQFGKIKYKIFRIKFRTIIFLSALINLCVRKRDKGKISVSDEVNY